MSAILRNFRMKLILQEGKNFKFRQKIPTRTKDWQLFCKLLLFFDQGPQFRQNFCYQEIWKLKLKMEIEIEMEIQLEGARRDYTRHNQL